MLCKTVCQKNLYLESKPELKPGLWLFDSDVDQPILTVGSTRASRGCKDSSVGNCYRARARLTGAVWRNLPGEQAQMYAARTSHPCGK